MENEVSLSHTRWECKYHIVWIPKYRKKVMYGQLRNHLGEVIRNLARHKESEVIETSDAGSYTHAHIDTAEILGISGDWIYEG